jgi:hypothetical protein
MSQTPLVALAALDPALLTEVVRQDQGSPTFTLHDWTVAPLSHHKIIDTTGGLYCFRGQGADDAGERPWSVVLKIVNGTGGDSASDPRHWAYWKREVLAYQSDLLANLPGPLVAPRCYGVREYEGGAWVWMEHIVETKERRWGLDDYALAAQHLGAFNGAYLTGTPLPTAPWLTDGFFPSIFAPDDWWAPHMDPNQPGNAWEHPVVQRWYPEPRKHQTLRLWAELDRFVAAADRLPQTFCHLDAHRRNLLRRDRAGGQPETVAIDWAFSGRGQIGADPGLLVSTSLFYFERDPATAAELETVVLDGYRAGLQRVGWEGDERLLRLGYATQVALWWATTMPGWTDYMLGEEQVEETTRQYGRSADAIAAGWLTLWEYAQDRAEEARRLIAQLGLAEKLHSVRGH